MAKVLYVIVDATPVMDCGGFYVWQGGDIPAGTPRGPARWTAEAAAAEGLNDYTAKCPSILYAAVDKGYLKPRSDVAQGSASNASLAAMTGELIDRRNISQRERDGWAAELRTLQAAARAKEAADRRVWVDREYEDWE